MRKKDELANPATWYHCTATNHGASWLPGRLRAPVLRPPTEPETPRICVARSVAACFAAVLFPPRKPVYVYRTAKPCRAVATRKVWDSCITGERWLIHRERMERLRVFSWDDVERVQEDIRAYHFVTRANSEFRLRLCQFLIAIDRLGPEWSNPIDRAAVAETLRRLGIPDPVAYIWGRIDEYYENPPPSSIRQGLRNDPQETTA